MNDLVSGAILLGYAIAGLFFWRFWRQTHDRLFAIFAVSFWMLGLQRLVLALTTRTIEAQAPLYVIRLFAYALILVAIVDKNRLRHHRRKSPRLRAPETVESGVDPR